VTVPVSTRTRCEEVLTHADSIFLLENIAPHFASKGPTGPF
jgi:hypothetical protein